MKKVIAAGSAIALAALPMAGVFATNPPAAGTLTSNIVDTLQIIVEPTCSFTDDNDGEPSNISYNDTVANGEKASFGVIDGSTTTPKTNHIFNVVCNDQDGWQVTAYASDLNPANTTTNDKKITRTAAAIVDDNAKQGTWSAFVNGTGVTEGGVYIPTAAVDGSSAAIIATAGATDSSTFTVTYDAYVGTETPADTYTGTVHYTLSNL